MPWPPISILNSFQKSRHGCHGGRVTFTMDIVSSTLDMYQRSLFTKGDCLLTDLWHHNSSTFGITRDKQDRAINARHQITPGAHKCSNLGNNVEIELCFGGRPGTN